MDIHIERPTLNRKTEKENIAVIDRWIADTSDKLNLALLQMSAEIKDLKDKQG